MPWTDDQRLSSKQSKATPALAVFRNRLHMVHLGNSSNDIWHSTFNGNTWTRDSQISQKKSKDSPALAVFRNRLHMVHIGNSSNDIWYSTFNGNTWTQDVRIPNKKSKASPILVVFRNRLYMFHLGDKSNQIWRSNFTGVGWTRDVIVAGKNSPVPPALAVYNRRLHMVYLGFRGGTSRHGQKRDFYWHTSFDGTVWSRSVQIPGVRGADSPSLAVFPIRRRPSISNTNDPRTFSKLYMVHWGTRDIPRRSNPLKIMRISQFDGQQWSCDIVIPNKAGRLAPALVVYQNRVQMIRLGFGSKKLWYSNFDGILSEVRIGIKILTNPTNFTIQQMLSGMRIVYASRGFLVTVVNSENLNLPALTTVNVGNCRRGNPTAAQIQLYQNRNNLNQNDIACYFVTATNPPLNGCASHQRGTPACVVASGASQWTLGHEVGHVLSLKHKDNNDLLMTGNGTANITNAPPDLMMAECHSMVDSDLSLE